MSDPEKPKHEYDPATGIRAEDDGDRPESLKQARQSFVGNVGSLLEAIHRKQRAGDTVSIAGGLSLPVELEPRIKHTYLGRSANGVTNSIARSVEPGVALYGDGVTSARVFEAVIPNEQGGWSTIVVTGTDPMLAKHEDGVVKYSAGKNGVVARISVESSTPMGDNVIDSNEKYEVLGDGRVNVPTGPLEPGMPMMNHHDRRTQGMEIGSMIVQELHHSLAGE